MNEILKKLNKEQQKAVAHENGPMLIVAGAGTGKTTVLINRLLNLIMEKGVSPDKILLTTFTEKGAGELVERADKVLPYGYTDLWISTFHGFCERILRDHALDIGLDSAFKLVSQTDQWILIKKNLSKFNLDYYKPLGNPNKFIHELLKHFSRLKDEDITAQEYLEYAQSLKLDSDNALIGKRKNSKSETMPTGRQVTNSKKFPNFKNSTVGSKATGSFVCETQDDSGDNEGEVLRINELAEAYHVYNQLLLDNSFLDFGDLIVYTLKLFKERKNILDAYREKFEYIMVDEFQDTNWAQYEMIKMLAAPKNNLMVVGDDDQAIFRFRGASMSNIMQFKDDYREASEIVLIENYRSGQEILNKAHFFITKNNPNRLEEKLKINKKLKSALKQPSAVEYFFYNTILEEAGSIAKKISARHKMDEYDWKDFAVLVRANDTADRFVKEFTRQGIPHIFVSLRGLYFKPIILDCIAYFKLLDNYHESVSLFRVLDMEIFKVRHLDIINLNKLARLKSWSLFEALLNNVLVKDLDAGSRRGIEHLLNLLRRHTMLAKTEKPSKVFVSFIYDSGILNNLDRDRDAIIYAYLNQFYTKIKKMEETNPDLRLKEFMEILDMELTAGETGAMKLNFDDADVVKIMTVHAAKWLEFKEVFLPDLVDKKFPTINRGEQIKIPDEIIREKLAESSEAHIEEERRLFYVAMTRAKEKLYLSGARDSGGLRDKKVSKFIEEAGITVSESADGAALKNELEKDLEDFVVLKKDALLDAHIPSRFSFSQLAAFDNCPLQYRFNFILKIPVPTKNQFLFGRIIHDTLYKFMLPLMDGKNNLQVSLFGGETTKALPSKKELLDIFKKTWKDDGWEDRQSRESYKKKAKDILDNFYTNLETQAIPEIFFLEKKFSFKLGGEIIKGAIDRVDRLADGTLEIVDYKTGSSKEKLVYKDKRQLILYKLVLEDLLKQPVSKLSFYYLDDGTKNSFLPSEKDIEKLKKEIKDTISEIKKGVFKASPSQLCGYCDFNTICEFRK